MTPGNNTPDSVSRLSDLSALLFLCEDEDGLIREAAVKRLGQLGNSEAIPFLIPRVNDPLPQVCVSAVQALMNLATPGNAAAFILSLSEIYSLKVSKVVNLHSFITALEKYLVSKENVSELLAGYRSADALTAKACQALIQKYKVSAKVSKPVKPAATGLASSDESTRVKASHSLKDLEGEAKDAALKLAIKDKSMPVRREAFLILLTRWGNETLAKEFLFDRHFELREIAIAHLKSKGTDVQYTYLRSLSDQDEARLCCALWGLAYLDSKECISQIKGFLKHPSEPVRQYAGNALKVLASADGRKTLQSWNSTDTYS